jgi:hypothetical protein
VGWGGVGWGGVGWGGVGWGGVGRGGAGRGGAGSDWQDLMNGKMNFASIMMKRISGNDCIGTRRFCVVACRWVSRGRQRDAAQYPRLPCAIVHMFATDAAPGPPIPPRVDRLCADQAATRASRERARRDRLHVAWVPLAECAY